MLWGGVDALDSVHRGVKPLYPPFITAFRHHSSDANWCLAKRRHAADPEKQTNNKGLKFLLHLHQHPCTVPPVLQRVSCHIRQRSCLRSAAFNSGERRKEGN